MGPLGTISLGDSSRTLMMTMMIMKVEVVKVMLGSVGLEGMEGTVVVVVLEGVTREVVMKRRRILVHLEVIIRMIPTMKTMKIAVMKRKMRKWRRRKGRRKGRKKGRKRASS